MLAKVSGWINIKYLFYFILIPIGKLNPTLNWAIIILGPLFVYKKTSKTLFLNQKKYFNALYFFIFIVIFSGVISIDPQYPIKIALNILSITLASLFISFNIQNKNDLMIFINSVFTASFIFTLLLYPLAFKDFTFDFIESETFGKNSSSLIIFIGLVANMLRIRLSKTGVISEIINFFFITSIFFTGSIKVILASSLLLIVFIFFKGGFQIKKVLLSSILLSVFVFAVLFYLQRYDPLENQSFLRITSRLSVLFGGESDIGYIDADYMTKYRSYLIKEGLELFYQNPIIGIGMENTRLHLGTYTHNNFVEILAGTGIIGFVSFMYLIFIIIKSSLRVKDKHIKIILLASLICFLFIANAQRIYDNRFLMVFLVSYLPMYRILNNEKK